MRSEYLAKVVCTTVGQAEEEGEEGETRTGKDSSALVHGKIVLSINREEFISCCQAQLKFKLS